MHLHSLELIGFKSFADKTLFEFHEGVTAIVGPNGCGKSNVLDAVRWVLGEQSAKALRGGEMADVIFNGTDTRKPVGFGEVSLTFTNCGSELGVDWHDVRVTRRVYRDGNSEYLLNKTVCRLRDIQALFADTGVGRSAYSIMEQGKIDMILSSRPEDRRTVFEEAAGITKYKTQKKEALRKLEATEANLLRISDIIKEVKRQIGSLQRQAGKARRYQALHADLKVLDTHFSHRKLRALETELGACADEIARISETEQETRSAIEAGEAKLLGLRSELETIDTRISEARAALQQLENEIASHRSRIEFNEQRATELNELIARGEREIESAEAKLREHEMQIDSANALVEETARLLEQKRAQLDELTATATQRREARDSAEEQLQELRLALSRDELRLNAATTELSELRERRETTQRDAESLAQRIEAATMGRDQLRARVEEARATTQTEQQSLEQLLSQLRTHEDELRDAQRAVADAEKQLAVVERAIAEKESRHDVLRQLNEEGEGLAKGSQALLKTEQFEFAGALVAHIEVQPEFVRAIEAALGRNLHAIVLKDSARAGEIVRYLNEHQLGQAALVLGEVEQHGSAGNPALPSHAIGWAIDKVNAPEMLAPIVRRLLRNVALFENIDGALDAMTNTSDIAAATVGGEFISHDGILFGGTGNVRADSLLERKVRIDALAAELRELRAERERADSRLREHQARVSSASGALDNSRATHQQAQAAQTAAVSKTTELEREEHAAERDFDILRSEHSALERQVAAADVRMQELTDHAAQLQQSIAEKTSDVSRLDAQRDEAASAEEDAATQLNELRIALATHEQKHETLLAQRAPMLARQTELTELIGARREDIANYRQRLSSQAEETENARAAIAARTEERATRDSGIASLVAERASQLETVNEYEAELRATRNRLSELQEQRGAFSVRQTQLQLQIEHLAEHAMQRYQIDLRAFEPDSYAHEKVLRAQMKRAPVAEVAGLGQAETQQQEPRPATAATEDELQKTIAEMTRQLDLMGPVNLDAVQEYDELEERYKFLEAQNTDLTNSKRELLDVIARINSTTQKLFAETFAQVRVNFRETFAELFGGGRADLQLLDENNPLDCGIEIIAKPPGKQLQSVSLLSGGEKTMTA